MAGRSRVNREIHARICGSVGVRFPCATRLGDRNLLFHHGSLALAWPMKRNSIAHAAAIRTRRAIAETDLSGLVSMGFGMVRAAAPLPDPGTDKIQHAPVDVGPAAL